VHLCLVVTFRAVVILSEWEGCVCVCVCVCVCLCVCPCCCPKVDVSEYLQMGRFGRQVRWLFVLNQKLGCVIWQLQGACGNMAQREERAMQSPNIWS
jgi:hypothetical protein